MDVVDEIQWIPEFGYAREMDWLHNMQDWMLSKKRYWGLALPIWVCDNKACNHHEVIGSEDELRERAVEGWDVFEGHTPHRPYVDAVKIACPKCGEHDDAHRGRRQPLARRWQRCLFHPPLPHGSRVLEHLVPRTLDQ